ncbi:MAG: SDR family oxidoreductase [Actinobacteria bacterium]|nr:MAG: SDR family oxidoreductase [Actinomycetota bacterium]
MDSFAGKLAIVTGGGSGMGRELVLQLAAEGCSVATCDIDAAGVSETAGRAQAGSRITTHVCDVSAEDEVLRFRDEVVSQHATAHVNLVFNNAGIGGGGSFIADERKDWERTFGIDWWGVYYCTRAFLPLLIASDDGYLVNTSSANGFWASLGPGVPHTAYSTAKFAVKGFSEALIEDLRVHAPHVKVAVVMPGHVGTDIVANSRRVLGTHEVDDIPAVDLERMRAQLTMRGLQADEMSPDQLREVVKLVEQGFRDAAPLTAAQAATIILDGVRAGRWRILVGDDARALDERVRADPETAYDHGGADLGTILLGATQPTPTPTVEEAAT